MWGQLTLVSALLATALAAPTSNTPCPAQCECTLRPDGHLALKCSSTDFLIKLHQKVPIAEVDLRHADVTNLHKLKELRHLEKLDLSNNGLTTLSLPHLPQLKTLKLSRNHLKDITANSLPKSLEKLDLSFNAFTTIPQELLTLKYLSKLNFYGNPVACTCELPNHSVHHKLIARGTIFVKPVECGSPREFKGKHLSSLKCHGDLERMQGDDPLSGIWSNEVLDDEPRREEDGIEQGFIVETSKHGDTSKHNLESASQVVDEEGSGDDFGYTNQDGTTASPEGEEPTEDPFTDYDEGSGDEDHTEEPELAILPICRFNCTENKEDSQEESSGENSTRKPLSIFEAGRILIDDIINVGTTTTEAPVVEDVVVPRNRMPQNMPPDKVTDKEVEVIAEKDLDEMDRQLTKPSDTASTTYIVIAALLILTVGLVLYVMIKKRNNRKRNRRNGAEPEKKQVEMKELLKKPVPEVHQPPEKAPLINGQNGTNAPVNGPGDEPANGIKKSPNGTGGDLGTGNGDAGPGNGDANVDSDEDVPIRRREDENLLTPETKRVTVQALELSVPKTPILVNRSLSNDGKIVSTSAEH